MKTQFKVTRKHIKEGVPNFDNPRKCVLALALLDAGFTNPSVGPFDLDFEEDGVLRRHVFSDKLALISHHFAQGSIENVPAFVVKLINRRNKFGNLIADVD
jgi:hypothetical protein